MNFSNTFVKIWNIEIPHQTANILQLSTNIPRKWRLFLLSDGSFTRNASATEEQKIKINIVMQKHKISPLGQLELAKERLQKHHRVLQREVWLVNEEKHRVAFAESYWAVDGIQVQQLYYNQPIGKSLVESEMDIRRELQAVYCGYSRRMDRHFKTSGPIWGRSYFIFSGRRPGILINEFFSPALVDQV
jgi:chorismate-pyruvate lyase